MCCSGQCDYADTPRNGVVYTFAPDNPNHDHMNFVRSASHTNGQSEERGKWTKCQCMGNLVCPEVGCTFSIKPQTTKEGIASQLKIRYICHHVRNHAPSRAHTTRAQRRKCRFHKCALDYIPCDVSVTRAKQADGSRTLEVSGNHSHGVVNQLTPARSVLKHQAAALAMAGVGARSMDYRTGAEQPKITKATMETLSRAKRKYEKEAHPDSSPLEAVAEFNTSHNTDYVLDPDNLGLKGFSCMDSFQKSVANAVVAELLDKSKPDDERAFDGFFFSDTTYSPCSEYYMQTTAVFDYELRITIVLLTTWMKRLDGISYSKHYDDLFENTNLLQVHLGAVKFCAKGFMMDFADAQVIGLALSYGKAVLRHIKKDTRKNNDMSFLQDARAIGEPFVKKHCFGCLFHFAQSVKKVSKHVSTDEGQRKKFSTAARKLEKMKADDFPGACTKLVKDFPLCENWMKWWSHPNRAHLIFEAAMAPHKLDDMIANHPTTNNNIEAYHRTFKRSCTRQAMPIYMAMTAAWNFSMATQRIVLDLRSGAELPRRNRSKQNKKRSALDDMQKEEFVERIPENASSLAKKSMRKKQRKK
jgi:hypothetical protein